MSLTDNDISKISDVVETVVRHELEPVRKDISDLKKDVGGLTTSVDGLVKTVNRHEHEWLVLRAQHGKMHDVLVKKGAATEQELAIT